MALKILQPGLRPIGQFSWDTDDAYTNLSGGEIGQLAVVGGSDQRTAADVGSESPNVEMSLASGTIGTASAEAPVGPIYICDEGIKGYGTQFGELIGAIAGQATSKSGAVVIGPNTSNASGKVTAWHQEGLYGLTAGHATDGVGGTTDAWENGITITTTVNAPLTFGLTTAGKWDNPAQTEHFGSMEFQGNDTTADPHRICGYMIGKVNDESLVSTTSFAATASAAKSYDAVHFVGSCAHIYTANFTSAAP
tara:strand:+ start:1080 stop:1832 length:753 start_codon:yes stop_codon:yes gene_type:complete